MQHTSELQPNWQYLHQNIDFRKEDIHLWHIPLRQPQTVVLTLRRLLSIDEKQRAAKFRYRHDMEHFIVARGAMRSVLSHYCDTPAAKITFEYSSHGKPSMRGSPLKFNLSHSGDMALLGIAANHDIGVDVELMREVEDANEIVTRFFSATEQRAFRKTPHAQRRNVFYNGWTRKEAFVKAIGSGLSFPLDAFDVSIGQHDPPELLRVDDHSIEIDRWRMASFEPSQGYKAAIASAGEMAPAYHFWRWN